MKKNLILIISLILVSFFGYQAYLQFTQTVQSSITLISPIGGEILEEGMTYFIKWETQNVPETNKIAINIRRVPPPPLSEEGQEFDPVVFVNLENTGSVEWEVSEMYPEGDYLLSIISYEALPITEDAVFDENIEPFHIIKPLVDESISEISD